MKTATWNETETLDLDDILVAAEMYRQIHTTKMRNEFIQGTSKRANLEAPQFDIITMDNLRKKLGRKWRVQLENLTKLAAVIEKVWIDSQLSDSITIAQNSPIWLNLLGKSHSQQVSKIIQQALSVGLLKLRTPAEYYNHVAASYWVNHNLAKMLIEASDDPTLPGEPIVNQISETLRKYLDAKFKDPYYRISPISIRSQCKISIPMTDEEVVCGVYECYPQYLDLLLDLSQINAMLPENERFMCSPTIDRDKNGNVIRVGLRAHNPWCHVKKREGLEKVDPVTVYREDLLDEKFGHWVEYDIKACVPSISLLITTGKWRDDTEDLYSTLSEINFETKEQRKALKELFLPMYFNASPEQAVARAKSEASRRCVQYSKEEWDTLTKVLFKGMCNMTLKIGKLGSEVFLHESCIEARVMLRMLKQGWHVVEVYDGFFIQTDGTEQDEQNKLAMAAQIVREEAQAYYERYHFEDELPDV